MTGTFTPTKSELSKALGYDVTETFGLSADSSVLIPVNAYARVEAYPAYQRATLTLGALCEVPTIVGSAVVLKPVGVYFATCGCIGPDPCGASCVPFGGAFPGPAGGPPGASGAGGASPASADAGAGDGG